MTKKAAPMVNGTGKMEVEINELDRADYVLLFVLEGE